MSLCGYRKIEADRIRRSWLIGITYRSTKWADDGIKRNDNWASFIFYTVAKYVSLLFANVINGFWLLGTHLSWRTCRVFSGNNKQQDRIKHVFVLML